VELNLLHHIALNVVREDQAKGRSKPTMKAVAHALGLSRNQARGYVHDLSAAGMIPPRDNRRKLQAAHRRKNVERRRKREQS
jgi:DNA-binding IclR family transcriptional regulator